jgi:hypothetical protein
MGRLDSSCWHNQNRFYAYTLQLLALALTTALAETLNILIGLAFCTWV